MSTNNKKLHPFNFLIFTSSIIKKNLIFFALFVALVFFATWRIQAQTRKTIQSENSQITILPKDINPRFSIKDIGMRHDQMLGQDRLSVFFTLTNKSHITLDLYAIILAYTETSTTDPKVQKYAPDYKWRNYYTQNNAKFNIAFEVTPPNLYASLKENMSPMNIVERKAFKKIESQVVGNVAFLELHPNQMDSIQFIAKNPNLGVKFKIFGNETPQANSVIVSDMPSQNQNNIKRDKRRATKQTDASYVDWSKIQKNMKNTHYIIYHDKYLTQFNSFHKLNPKLPRENFFNKVSVFIFDANLADNPETRKSSLLYYKTVPVSKKVL